MMFLRCIYEQKGEDECPMILMCYSSTHVQDEIEDL